MSQRIYLPKYLDIGANAVANLPLLLADLRCKKPLVLSDKVMDNIGNVSRIRDLLAKHDIASDQFLDTMTEPDEASLLPAVELFKSGGFDCIIALGGGSVIDSAKAIGLLAKHGGRMRDYKVPHIVNEEIVPIVAIPTTAGTGSEVTKVTIITDNDTDEKMLCMGPGLLPVASIIDYELSMTAPARIAADTGIDALTHAIEAYVSQKAGLFTEQLALSAMGLIAPNLREAVNNPKNLLAKEKIMLGANMAGMAFSNASVALVHGMSRPIGAHFHVPHGMSNAMLLPDITEFSIPSAIDKYADCARAMGIADKHESDKVAVAALIEELVQLNADLGVPSLAEFGVKEAEYFDSLDLMAEQAIASGSPGNNPKVPSKEDIIQLYRKVWH
ncbi:iron-containing alcohol dehydrogenase [Reinekea sp.]|jgi:alcohol dehydrogenase class IV|uniref:iron-containing alcohol dehydrogenase n=1 Tax=Reinekea sp. TaxID=1970455 RepID=UPI00398968B4